MELESYFDFQSEDDIRIKGTRIGIETVLDAHLTQGMTAEQIRDEYPLLSLEQVYATILYYHANRDRVTAYMEAWERFSDEVRAAAETEPDPLLRRVRAIRNELASYPPNERPIVFDRIVAKHKARDEKLANADQVIA